MSRLKRVSMAGSDVAVTDAVVADLVLEYAMHLGRAAMTDIVTVPIARHGRAEQASLLLGPASQIALTDNDDDRLDAVELPDLEVIRAGLERRLAAYTGGGPRALDDDGFAAFPDFGPDW